MYFFKDAECLNKPVVKGMFVDSLSKREKMKKNYVRDISYASHISLNTSTWIWKIGEY